MFHSEVGLDTEIAHHRSRPIVLAADAAYAMPLATTLRSLTENNESAWPLNIHVIHDRFDDALMAKLISSLPSGSVTIGWHQANPQHFAKDYAVLPHISKMTYARLLLPSLLSDVRGKVLYLDSDTLVLGTLEALWNTDLAGQVLGAVRDPLDSKIKAGVPGLEGAPLVERYFNAGILLIDLCRWRKEQISEHAIDYLDRHPNSPFSDQDALNWACEGLWSELAEKWNFQCQPEDDIASLPIASRPTIVHFVTGLKPWKPYSLSRSAGLYETYRSRTLFARSRRDRLADAIRRVGHLMLRHSALLRAMRDLATPLVSPYSAARLADRSRSQDS